MANETNLTGQNTENNTGLTPEQEDEAAYKAAYQSVKTGETPSAFTVSTVDKDGNVEQVAPAKPSATNDEQGSNATEGDEGEGKEPKQGGTKEGEPGPNFSNADSSTSRKPAPKEVEERDGGQPEPKQAAKTKKPSVFDEARQLHENLDEEARKPLSNLISHAAKQEKRAKELQHRLDSDDGRVRGMQRTIDELRSQLAAAQTRPFSGAPVSDGKAAPTAKVEATNSEIMDFVNRSPKLKEIHSTDPELASFLAEREVLRDKEKTQESTEKEVSVQQRTQLEQHDRYVRTQADIIAQRIPNIGEVLKHDWWKGWLDSAPAYIKKMASSDHAEEVLHVMDLYFRDISAYQQQNGEADDVTDPADTERVDKLVEDRNRRAKANAGAPSSIVRPTKPEFDEAEEYRKGYKSVQVFTR